MQLFLLQEFSKLHFLCVRPTSMLPHIHLFSPYGNVVNRYLEKCLTDFHRTYISDALWDRDDATPVFDAVGWVFWPVKPTTESENWLQLDSVSTSLNIDRLTMVDNMSAAGNDSRPQVVLQSIKWLLTITRGRRIPPDSESGGIPHLFGTSVPPYRQRLPGSSWQQQQQQVKIMTHRHFTMF